MGETDRCRGVLGLLSIELRLCERLATFFFEEDRDNFCSPGDEYFRVDSFFSMSLLFEAPWDCWTPFRRLETSSRVTERCDLRLATDLPAAFSNARREASLWLFGWPVLDKLVSVLREALPDAADDATFVFNGPFTDLRGGET